MAQAPTNQMIQPVAAVLQVTQLAAVIGDSTSASSVHWIAPASCSGPLNMICPIARDNLPPAVAYRVARGHPVHSTAFRAASRSPTCLSRRRGASLEFSITSVEWRPHAAARRQAEESLMDRAHVAHDAFAVHDAHGLEGIRKKWHDIGPEINGSGKSKKRVAAFTLAIATRPSRPHRSRQRQPTVEPSGPSNEKGRPLAAAGVVPPAHDPCGQFRAVSRYRPAANSLRRLPGSGHRAARSG